MTRDREKQPSVPARAPSAHTPGPWRVDHDEQVPERGRVYIHARGRFNPDEVIGEAYWTDGDVDDGTHAETEANALLIAAAPDLLAALKGVVAIADRKTDEFDRARAAIAKAEGRS